MDREEGGGAVSELSIAVDAQVPHPESSVAAPPAAPATSAAAQAEPTARPRAVRTRPLHAGGAVYW